MNKRLKFHYEVFKGWFFEGIALLLIGFTITHHALNRANQTAAAFGLVIAVVGLGFTIYSSVS
jgi:hypothetical protein